MDNNSLSHCKWECQYHIVFIPKYRKKVLYGKVRDDIREIIKTLCKYKRVEIIAGAVCSDHVHLCVSIPPKLSVSEFVGYLKGKSALMIYDKHPEMGNKWDRSFWARGYYVVTVGNITEENVKEYIDTARQYINKMSMDIAKLDDTIGVKPQPEQKTPLKEDLEEESGS